MLPGTSVVCLVRDIQLYLCAVNNRSTLRLRRASSARSKIGPSVVIKPNTISSLDPHFRPGRGDPAPMNVIPEYSHSGFVTAFLVRGFPAEEDETQMTDETDSMEHDDFERNLALSGILIVDGQPETGTHMITGLVVFEPEMTRTHSSREQNSISPGYS